MTKIIFTVDVEANYGIESIDSLIYGKTNRGSYGVDYLSKKFLEYGIRGLFFVDFAEAKSYGIQPFKNICNILTQNKQDIGVHIHANHFGEPSGLMNNCSLNLQEEMMDFSTTICKEITHNYPLSFRAGGYGANNSTIELLKKYNYIFDFSFFYKKKNCKIAPPITIYKNTIFENGIIEIPVTVFYSTKIRKIKKVSKIDFEMPMICFKSIIKKMIRSNYDSITFFIHSFSLVEWRSSPHHASFSKRRVSKFERMLKWLSKQDVEFAEEANFRNIVSDCDYSCETQINSIVYLNPFLSFLYNIHSYLSLKKMKRDIKKNSQKK